MRSPTLKQISKPDESERDFRIRLQMVAREQRDRAVESLRKKYAPKLLTLQERVRRAQQAVEREEAQVKEQGLQTAISFGATLLGAFAGRKTVSRSNLGRATTAIRGVSRTMTARQDIDRAGDTVDALKEQLKDLQAQFDEETDALEATFDPQMEDLETVIIKPKKTDISVQLVALAWVPYWQDETGRITSAV